MKTFELKATPDVWEEVVCFRYDNWDTVIKSGSLYSLSELLRDYTEGTCILKKKDNNAWEIKSISDRYSAKWEDDNITVLKRTPGSAEWREVSQELPF